MTVETEAIRFTERYLIDLGYSSASLTRQVKTKYGMVDMVVYEDEMPRIVIEVKEDDLPRNEDVDALPFHPYVRKAQSYAQALNAPYYAITNGKTFLWFLTDDRGRPRLLPEPVPPLSSRPADTEDPRPSRAVVVRVLEELRYFLLRLGLSRSADMSDVAALMLYLRLRVEQGDQEVGDLFRRPEVDEGEFARYLPFRISRPSVSSERDWHIRAYHILERISFTAASPQDVLGAVDRVFLPHSAFRFDTMLPRWLSDFLVQLAEIGSNDTLFDISDLRGDIAAAARMVSPQTLLWTLSSERRAELWVNLQRALLGETNRWSVIAGQPAYEMDRYKSLPQPSRVVTVPPFSRRLAYRPSRELLPLRGPENRSEDVYLDLALRCVSRGGRVVALVPDSLLFAQDRQWIRRFLVDRAFLVGVVSIGTFLPDSGLRTSALVLEKGTGKYQRPVFMARILGGSIKDGFSSWQIPQVSPVLTAFREWSAAERIEHSTAAWTVKLEELDSENLTVERYVRAENSELDSLGSSFRMAPLRDVLEVMQRGSNTVIDEQGDLPVIGPAAIRPTVLDTTKLDRTSNDKLGTAPRLVQSGDVVMNAISTHRGAAAVVSPDAASAVANRHVIIMRPKVSVILPEYLAIALHSRYVQQQMSWKQTGALIPALTIRALDEVTIPLPDLETQREVIARVEELRAKRAKAELQLKEAEERLAEAIEKLGYEEEAK